MKYFIIKLMGDNRDRELAFIDRPPKDLGVFEYCMARGVPIGDHYPTDASVFLQPNRPGIKLASLLGNVKSYLIVNTEMKNVIEQHCQTVEVEYLSFTLYNHKKRVHSKDYWIINPIGYVDCVNRKASKITYLSTDPTKIVAVDKFSLDASKLHDAPDLFRVPEDKSKIFISERLATAFKQKKFTNVLMFDVDVVKESGSASPSR